MDLHQDCNLLYCYYCKFSTNRKTIIRRHAVECMKKVLTKGLGMDVNESLLEAIRCGRLERVRELINTYGLSYLNSWGNGYDLLYLALDNQHADVAEFLLSKGAEVNRGNSDRRPGFTPLHLAASNGDVKIVEMLMNKNAQINVKSELCCSPLEVAIQHKATSVVQLLLKNGADINAKGYNGFTPLHMAVYYGNQECAKILMSQGANVNDMGGYGLAPLHLAAVNVHREEMNIILLSKGADVNVKGSNGVTPLHLAVEHHNDEIIKILLLHGADVNAVGDNGLTPLDIAHANRFGDEEDYTKVHDGFISKCQDEIAKIKIQKVANIPYYDILTKITTSSLAIYMRNKNIAAAFKSDNYEKKFKKYARMIKSKFSKAMERIDLLEQGYQIFHFFINNYECTDNIFSYLSNKDIRMLINAFKPLGISSPNIDSEKISIY